MGIMLINKWGNEGIQKERKMRKERNKCGRNIREKIVLEYNHYKTHKRADNAK